MSLDLGKSGSYIRSITSGISLPSLHELFNIMSYFEMSPVEFFEGSDNCNSLRSALYEKLQSLDSDDIQKVSIFIDWIKNR